MIIAICFVMIVQLLVKQLHFSMATALLEGTYHQPMSLGSAKWPNNTIHTKIYSKQPLDIVTPLALPFEAHLWLYPHGTHFGCLRGHTFSLTLQATPLRINPLYNCIHYFETQPLALTHHPRPLHPPQTCCSRCAKDHNTPPPPFLAQKQPHTSLFLCNHSYYSKINCHPTSALTPSAHFKNGDLYLAAIQKRFQNVHVKLHPLYFPAHYLLQHIASVNQSAGSTLVKFASSNQIHLHRAPSTSHGIFSFRSTDTVAMAHAPPQDHYGYEAPSYYGFPPDEQPAGTVLYFPPLPVQLLTSSTSLSHVTTVPTPTQATHPSANVGLTRSAGNTWHEHKPPCWIPYHAILQYHYSPLPVCYMCFVCTPACFTGYGQPYMTPPPAQSAWSASTSNAPPPHQPSMFDMQHQHSQQYTQPPSNPLHMAPPHKCDRTDEHQRKCGRTDDHQRKHGGRTIDLRANWWARCTGGGAEGGNGGGRGGRRGRCSRSVTSPTPCHPTLELLLQGHAFWMKYVWYSAASSRESLFKNLIGTRGVVLEDRGGACNPPRSLTHFPLNNKKLPPNDTSWTSTLEAPPSTPHNEQDIRQIYTTPIVSTRRTSHYSHSNSRTIPTTTPSLTITRKISAGHLQRPLVTRAPQNGTPPHPPPPLPTRRLDTIITPPPLPP